MAPRAAFYNPDQVVVYFLGALLSGFDEDEFLTVAQMAPGFEDVVGVDGEVARSRTNDRRLKINVKLLQTSLSNATLSAAHKSDLNSNNGAGVGTFLMQDLSGNSLVNGAQSWVVSYPDSSYARKAKGREWEIHVAFGDRTEGGN